MGELVKVRLGDRDIEVARHLAEIDLDNLTREYQETGGEAVWWGVLHARAVSEVERAKLRRDVLLASLDKKNKKKLYDQGESRVTERMLDGEASQTPEYQKALEEVIEAEEKANILKATFSAIERKDRKLEVLGNLIRQEVSVSGTKVERTPLLPKAARAPLKSKKQERS